MSRQRSTDSRQAFTLLELMLVVFIVAILAALLLPVLGKAKGRARQIECLNQLHQVGVAAQVFAHDHGDRFPFQVPVKEGGTLELVQAASGLGGDVQYAFRHFQTLSNDLVLPKLLACPSDARTNAPSFSQLRNDHISYFIAVTAEPGRPDSVLAGDRNIVARDGSSGSILRISGGTEVVWSRGGHEYRGNLLFAGGHVERTGNAGLQAAMQSPTGPVSAWLPAASPSGTASASPSGGSGSGGAPGGNAGGGRSGGGAASSGFAALQNFFTAPTPSAQSTPETPPSDPVVSVPPPEKPVPQPPPVAPVPPPAPVPKPVAKPIAEAKPPAPVVATKPVAEPTPAVNDEPTPSVLLIFIEPERCWWCWVLFLLVCVAASVTLGVLIQRRKEKRARETAHAVDPSATLPRSATP